MFRKENLTKNLCLRYNIDMKNPSIFLRINSLFPKSNFSFLILFLLLLTSNADAQKLTIKNTFGADSENFSDYDIFTSERQTDINQDISTSNIFSIGDQLQADYKSSLLTGRLRLESAFQNGLTSSNGEDSNSGYPASTAYTEENLPSFIFAPSGFVHFTPIEQFGLALGTSFYKQFAIPSAYLAAADDTSKYGRLITDSLGHEEYLGNESIALLFTGFAGGLSSNWYFGQSQEFYLKSAAGLTFAFTSENSTSSDSSGTEASTSSSTSSGTESSTASASDSSQDSVIFEYALDAGFNFGKENLFDIGFTAHDITSDSRKIAAFAGLTCIPDAVMNIGFYYNFTSSDFLPESRVTRSDDDTDLDIYKYKKQKTKYALGASGGYYISSIGLGLYADVISGLNDEYIGQIEYVNSDGTSTYESASIKRGQTIVKYKQKSNGSYKAKRTDEFVEGAIPFYSQLRLTFDANPDLNLAFNFKLRTMLGDSDSTCITLYPRATYSLPDNIGSLSAGIRMEFNLTRYDGLSSISLPFTYTWKMKKKF
ncbi:MAG: hypothetical protein K6E78_05825 [Treponema sp.]|nr:hypothetical protein [Treponema sp.]